MDFFIAPIIMALKNVLSFQSSGRNKQNKLKGKKVCMGINIKQYIHIETMRFKSD